MTKQKSYSKLQTDSAATSSNETVVIEGKVDQCLANYFCDDHKKKDDLLWLVLRQRAISFSSKLCVLSAITKDTSIQADADYLNSVRTPSHIVSLCTMFLTIS
jgi:hypothetical protein